MTTGSRPLPTHPPAPAPTATRGSTDEPRAEQPAYRCGRSLADVVRHLWLGRTLFCTDPVDNHLVLGDLRQWFDPEKTPRAGENPDYRFSLANERTFLAWIRTGLALIAGGLACAQFLPPLPIEYLREIISIALLLLGGLVALRAVDHWARTERAMRTGADLPGSRFPAILSIVVAAGALLLVVAVLIRALA